MRSFTGTPVAAFESFRITISKYSEGLSDGDITLLRTAFHPKATTNGYHGKTVMMAEIEELFSYVAAQEAPVTTGEQHRCLITKIVVNGKVAPVEAVEENCFGANYVNYFQILIIEEQWLVMAKVFNKAEKKTPISASVPANEQAMV